MANKIYFAIMSRARLEAFLARKEVDVQSQEDLEYQASMDLEYQHLFGKGLTWRKKRTF